jgi:putative transposase
MRIKREIIEGAVYHVTSRTNGKIKVLDNIARQRIMLVILEEAKDKFGFRLHNFCFMPNHFHLLITPASGTNLSHIMQWIKTRSAKSWNFIHSTTDHLWGERFFSRVMKNWEEYLIVHNYIDQNPVKAGHVICPSDWKASGAYYIANNIEGLVDFLPFERQRYIKLLPDLRSPFASPSSPFFHVTHFSLDKTSH